MIIWLITDPRNRRETKEEPSPLKKKKITINLTRLGGRRVGNSEKKTTEVQLINFYLRTYVWPKAKEKIDGFETKRKKRLKIFFLFVLCVWHSFPLPPIFCYFFPQIWSKYVRCIFNAWIVCVRQTNFLLDGYKKVTCNYTHTHTRAQATKKRGGWAIE